MPNKKKRKVFSILPLYHEPISPDFCERFMLLSSKCGGHVFSLTTKGDLEKNIRFGEYTYHPIPFDNNKLKCYLRFYKTVLLEAIKANKHNELDVIHAYDPLALGLLAVLVKIITNKKLVIEINGHLKEDGFFEKNGLTVKLKKAMFIATVHAVIRSADHIKLLNPEQIDDWKSSLRKKSISIFHDFVATHVFEKRIHNDSNYILFMGYPFFRKGVDILIKSFLEVSAKYPDVVLKIIGWCPGGETERQKYVKMANGNKNVEILKPVPFKQAIRIIEDCRFFVLPSRSEAMGRVLLEAMAAGKPLVGSKVGGIQHIIRHGENGVLFESENVMDLAQKLDALLGDQERCKKMGEASIKLVEQFYSVDKYVERYAEMIESLS